MSRFVVTLCFLSLFCVAACDPSQQDGEGQDGQQDEQGQDGAGIAADPNTTTADFDSFTAFQDAPAP